MSTSDILLFMVDGENTCRIGHPPQKSTDNYHTSAKKIGKIENACKITHSPDGKLYVVHGSHLYEGPFPNCEGMNWFKGARRIGKEEWDNFKLITFDLDGKLYAVTHEGDLFKGHPPSNENESWIDKAKKIGGGKWNALTALFFDPKGMFYALTSDKFVKGPCPTEADKNWLDHAEVIGGSTWATLSHLIAFSPDGDLWCVNRSNGEIFAGPPPTNKTENWQDKAQKLGTGYQVYKYLSFLQDKTIMKILCLRFLIENGNILNQKAEVVEEKVFDNKGGNQPLNLKFEIDKTFMEKSVFSEEHGFKVGVDGKTTFKTGIPKLEKDGSTIGINIVSPHKWDLTKPNETEKQFILSVDLTIDPGKTERKKATVHRATLNIPYSATVLNLYGCKTMISGTWTGDCYYNLQVEQSQQ
ncbi:uncharacterized protein [Pleurodeles waltl]